MSFYESPPDTAGHGYKSDQGNLNFIRLKGTPGTRYLGYPKEEHPSQSNIQILRLNIQQKGALYLAIA